MQVFKIYENNILAFMRNNGVIGNYYGGDYEGEYYEDYEQSYYIGSEENNPMARWCWKRKLRQKTWLNQEMFGC